MRTLDARPLSIAAGLFLLAGLAAPALGQNALGDGRALDRNLSTQGPVNNRVKDVQAQIRFAQRVIEGQAGLGRSFRGDLGYRATDDFGDVLSTDDTYAFRRDSASGALVAEPGLRGTDALRYQFALTGGGGARASTANTPLASMLYVEPRLQVATGGNTAEPTSFNRIAASTTGMRSVSQYQATSALLPTILAVMGDEQGGRVAVTASPLRGIGPTAAVLPELAPGRTAGYTGGGITGLERKAFGVADIDQARPVTKPEPPPGFIDQQQNLRQETDGSPYRIVVESFMKALDTRPIEPGRKDALKPPEDRKDPAAEPKPDERAIDQPAGLPPQWARELQTLRERLQRDPSGRPKGRGEATPNQPDGRQPPVNREDPLPPGEDRAIEALKRMDAKLQTLRPQDMTAGEAFALYMAKGESQLGAGEYFNAEASFSMALSAKPREITAALGRAHAQLGAGLFLSAAGNLRAIFAEHPEMIPVKYEARLFPSATRSEDLAARLRRELGELGTALGADGALLLAYLGHQFERPEWIVEGLEKYDSFTAGDDAPGRELGRVLRAVWQPQAEPKK